MRINPPTLFQRIGTNVYTFEEPGELVTEGLYGISRNPMYLGLVVAGAGRGPPWSRRPCPRSS